MWHVLRFTSAPHPCNFSITSFVYTVGSSVWGSCCRLSRYVFVCFGNGFQVAIVAYVTRWLMGKIHLLLTPPPLLPPQTILVWLPRWTHSEREQVPSHPPDKVTHWRPGALFGPAGRAFKSRRSTFCKQGWICVAMTAQPPKEKAEIICVDGLGVPLFIGHVTPWGRTNWWPQRAPCFVPAAHKDIGVRSRRGWGWRRAAAGGDREIEQVSHRIVGWN